MVVTEPSAGRNSWDSRSWPRTRFVRRLGAPVSFLARLKGLRDVVRGKARWYSEDEETDSFFSSVSRSLPTSYRCFRHLQVSSLTERKSFLEVARYSAVFALSAVIIAQSSGTPAAKIEEIAISSIDQTITLRADGTGELRNRGKPNQFNFDERVGFFTGISTQNYSSEVP